MAVITSSEALSEPRTSSDTAEMTSGKQKQLEHEEKEESTMIDDVSGEVAAQPQIWIRTEDRSTTTNCVQPHCTSPDRNNSEVPAAVSSFKAAVITPLNKTPRQSALPLPVTTTASSPSFRVPRRKPPPIPVRSSSVPQSTEQRSTNGETTTSTTKNNNSSNVTIQSVACSDVTVQHQKTSSSSSASGSKNGLASRGCGSSRDCSAPSASAAREAESALTLT